MGCRLLIVADDFTGALDTAAALAREGIATGVVTLDGLPGGRLSRTDIQRETVLVVDTESRHLPAEKAYEIYHTLCSSAQEIPHVYIKTDSVLRGNLSASLAGAVDGLKEHPAVYFLPAFPAAGRTTQGGRQYLDGVAVDQTVFARDPLNPVRESRVSRMVDWPYRFQVQTLSVEDSLPNWQGIGRKAAVLDAQTQQHLQQWGKKLECAGNLRLTAGCAGFAACFPELLKLPSDPSPLPLWKRLLVICGSASEITFCQLQRGEKAGWPLVSPEFEALLSGYPEKAAAQLKKLLTEQGKALFAVSKCREQVEGFTAFCQRQDMTATQIHEAIQRYLSRLALRMKDAPEGFPDGLAVFGGDTLASVLGALGICRLRALGEVEPGVPVSMAQLDGKPLLLITKSGGLGSEDVLERISGLYQGRAEEGEGLCS